MTMKNERRERLLMDANWRFRLGHAADTVYDFGFDADMFAKCADTRGHPVLSPNFDEGSWRLVDLPHDWCVELPFEGPQGDGAMVSHGFKGARRSRPGQAVGWYRRSFDIPKSDEGRRIRLEFDGVYRDCMVWVNGHFFGRHWSGYSSFSYDITDVLNYGGRNLVVVRVDASFLEGWFYEGAGIYRHVWLTKTAPVHVAHWGHHVVARPDREPRAGQAAAGRTSVTVTTRVVNESDDVIPVTVETMIRDAAGKRVAVGASEVRRLRPWEETEISQDVAMRNAKLWSIETPHLYTAVTVVRTGQKVSDTIATAFGVRTFRFDKDKGFFLNGESVKIKGVCCHQDHAGVGSALPDAIQAFRIRRLKEMGCNAYRTSHNAPTPELLDECDRQGMLVMDEQRIMGSAPEVLGQLERMILRDRNHPSIVIWSVGNEEHEIQGTVAGRRVAATMKRLVRKLDPTRPVTAAMNNGGAGEGFIHVMDVHGWNYFTIGNIDEWHKNHPDIPIVGSEEASTLCTRGVYVRDPAKGHVTAYDQELPGWGKTAEGWWRMAAERPWYAGGFIWTGFDYRGEPTPYQWPCISSHFGVLDTCGFPKDNFYYYRAWWTDQPVLHLFPHWNWAGREGQPIDVRCFSNCDEVELFLNGTSQGRKPVPTNSHVKWDVPYVPGTLVARGYKAGKPCLTAKVETVCRADAIRLDPDRADLRADGEDVALITVSLWDHRGRFAATADSPVSFTVTPNARIIGVGNGDPSSHEADKACGRRAFNGLCQVIVQTTRRAGAIRLKATSPGLKPAQVVLRARACVPRPAVS